MIRVTNGREAIVRLVDGEDLVQSLLEIDIDSAVIVGAIGMLRALRFGYWNGRTYEEKEIENPVELISMQGTIARSADGRAIHCHVSAAGRDGVVHGGHLLAATVTNTAEIALLLIPGIALDRRRESNGLLGLFPSLEDVASHEAVQKLGT
jgi:predicted DNA-binding protein with PD1-like motif